MTKFENNGIQLQCDSVTIEEAKSNLRNSCRICCSIGLRTECKRCLIQAAHDLTISALNDVKNCGVHHTCCPTGCYTATNYDTTKCQYSTNKVLLPDTAIDTEVVEVAEETK
jgi:hypothetical protein